MLFGHQDKISLFKRLVKENNLSHAYLFYGPPQIGKFCFARTLAYFLENGEFKPPANGKEVPLLDSKIFLPDERKIIGVDNARELKFFLTTAPFKSPRRLAIINDAEALTDEAQSALLKIVEEPPPRAMIIFITYDPQALFAPLRSRLVQVYFPPLSKNELREILVKNYRLAEKEAEEVSRKSFGRIGRAVNLIAKKKSKEKDSDLLKVLEGEIVDLYMKGFIGNSALLSELLSRQTALHRFNLNQNLERKAIEYLINNNEVNGGQSIRRV